MKVRIVAGEVEVRIDGLDLTKRDLDRLLHTITGLAAVLATPTEPEQPTPEHLPLGFTALVERAPDLPEPDLSEYFDE